MVDLPIKNDSEILNMAIEIVDFPLNIEIFPLKSMVIFHSYVKLAEGMRFGWSWFHDIEYHFQ